MASLDSEKMTIYTVENRLRIDTGSRRVYDLENEMACVELTRLDYDILLYLCENAGNVRSYDMIIEHVKPDDMIFDGKDVLQKEVSRLRKKLVRQFGEEFVEAILNNIRDIGYRLDGKCECAEIDSSPSDEPSETNSQTESNRQYDDEVNASHDDIGNSEDQAEDNGKSSAPPIQQILINNGSGTQIGTITGGINFTIN